LQRLHAFELAQIVGRECQPFTAGMAVLNPQGRYL